MGEVSLLQYYYHAPDVTMPEVYPYGGPRLRQDTTTLNWAVTPLCLCWNYIM